MTQYRIDIRLPVGLEIEFEYKQEFEGLVKSLLLSVLEDLESNSTSHYKYFINKRIDKVEKVRLIEILRLVDEKHQEKSISTESFSKSRSKPNYKQPFRRYLDEETI